MKARYLNSEGRRASQTPFERFRFRAISCAWSDSWFFSRGQPQNTQNTRKGHEARNAAWRFRFRPFRNLETRDADENGVILSAFQTNKCTGCTEIEKVEKNYLVFRGLSEKTGHGTQRRFNCRSHRFGLRGEVESFQLESGQQRSTAAPAF